MSPACDNPRDLVGGFFPAKSLSRVGLEMSITNLEQNGVERRLAFSRIPTKSSRSNVSIPVWQQRRGPLTMMYFASYWDRSSVVKWWCSNTFFLYLLVSYFRFSEEAVKRSGNPNVMMKNPGEMESQVYSKAKTKVNAFVTCISSFKKFQFLTYVTFL